MTAEPKVGINGDGRTMHYSVGAVIKRGEKYLLLDRLKVPLGWAGIAGHVDEGEEALDALLREVPEECGLQVVGTPVLLLATEAENTCSRGIPLHAWQVFQVEIEEGEPRIEDGKAKGQGWFTAAEIQGLELEPIWEIWFTLLGVIE